MGGAATPADALFFFSGRRRHTSCGRDWSSDVCSSDLASAVGPVSVVTGPTAEALLLTTPDGQVVKSHGSFDPERSEERRVGKECRARRATEEIKKKTGTTNMQRNIGRSIGMYAANTNI